MNYKMSLYIMGAALRVEAVFMLVPLVIAAQNHETFVTRAFLYTSVAVFVLGALLARRQPENTAMYAREGFAIVALCWLMFSLCGAFPYFLSGAAPSFADCLFESVSGFTTSGVSVFVNIETLPKGLLFWRAFTQWIGGMGVLVFVLSYLPATGGHLVHILRAESQGPSVGKMMPKLSSHAKGLYIAYIVLTALQTIFLRAGGMPLFDSLLHSFTTAGTGGFSIRDASIGYYHSAYIEWVLIIFMILFGTNLAIFYMAFFKRMFNVMRNEELRAYLIIMLVSIAVIMANLYVATFHGFELSFREAVFHTISFMTTTGFVTVDFVSWPAFSQVILFFIMLIGTCTFSTGGGIKVSRILILAKSTLRSVRRIVHPQSVTLVTLDKRPVEENTVSTVGAFFNLYMMILIGSTLLLTLAGNDLSVSVTAAVSTLTNTGPGANFLGPLENYAAFNAFSEIVLMINMLLGRLEIFPLLILLSPENWTSRSRYNPPPVHGGMSLD